LVVIEDLGDFRVQAVLLERSAPSAAATNFAALTAGSEVSRLAL